MTYNRRMSPAVLVLVLMNPPQDVPCTPQLAALTTGSYSVHPYQLLLSSKASRGQLVGVAATFLTGD